MNKKKVQIAVLILLMSWYGLFFMEKIDLTTSDLGRHIKNGEMILDGQFGVLNTNFYSYTEPDYKFINHHWGSGVIFYLIWKVFGFIGLSIFCLLISLITFFLFFKIAQKESNFKIAFLISLLLIPLMVARNEIRPEIFSYFFIALFFWILWHWRKNKLDSKWLFVLPILGIFWVNLHIYFVFGPALIGLFLVDHIIRKKRINKKLGIVLILTGLVSLLNPFFIKGLIYPFNIFKSYGYRIVENQSVWFLENWGFNSPNLKLFEICLAILIISFIVLLIRNRKRFSFVYFTLAIVWSFLGLLAIRNFTLFGFFALIIIVYNLRYSKLQIKKISLSLIILLSLAIFLISFFVYYQKLPLQEYRFGFGLMENNNQSMDFFREHNLQGRIFNNYDIGGYLIYHLFPERNVFTDNRPEAYSIYHFQDIYIPAQTNNTIWQEQDNIYDFNIIYFSHRDYTQWGQQFLIERVKDNNWAVVYYDPFAIIFLKRNDINKLIIDKYEIPKEIFGIKK